MPPAKNDRRSGLLDQFTGYLRDRGMPVTRQRRLVAESVFAATDHPSVDGIQRALREREEHVGTATVYRVLEVLLASGLVREHDFGEGHKRYEAAGDGVAPHEHLLCQRCGRVQEFVNDRLTRMLHLVAEEQGFRPTRHRVVVYGLCVDCRNRDLDALEPAGEGA